VYPQYAAIPRARICSHFVIGSVFLQSFENRFEGAIFSSGAYPNPIGSKILNGLRIDTAFIRRYPLAALIYN
jgi:hypothetical protein